MKLFVKMLVLSLAALCLAEFENIKPIEEMPGFWDGHEHLRKNYVQTSDRGGRITMGQVAEPGQFPYMAFVSIATGSGTFSCGGSIINGFTVLTAAHCVDMSNLISVLLILGAHDRTIVEPSQLRITVMPPGVILHPDYDEISWDSDVALLRFAPIVFTPRIQPIRLPFADELNETFNNEASSLSGWGLTEFGSTSPNLRFIRHSVITNDACRVFWPETMNNLHICSSTNEGRSGCDGDSGGPLTVIRDGQSLQVGIVSFGTVDCMFGWPSVYVRVTTFVEWIQNH